jgi:ATP-dependent RNA helicase MSS116
LGFKSDIEAITAFLPPPPERQTLLFSATVTEDIRQIASSTMSKAYQVIDCVPEVHTPVHEHIPQYHTVVANPSQLLFYLIQLITHDQLVTGGNSKIIIFFPTMKAVILFSDLINQVAHRVLPAGIKTELYVMHVKLNKDKRKHTSNGFMNDTSGSSILVTTDVSARGVDYPGVTRVIQMGVPATRDLYSLRVGRTGRDDSKKGRGDLILCSWEMGFLKRQLGGMPLKPLILSDMLQETKELAKSKDAEIGKTSDCSRRLSEIAPLCREVLRNVDDETAHDVFMAQVGFFFGRIHEMGINKEEAFGGLQDWAKRLFSLDGKPNVSVAIRERLGLLANADVAPDRKKTSRPSSPLKVHRIHENTRDPWVGRENTRVPWEGRENTRVPWEGRENTRVPWEGRENTRVPWEGRENTRVPWEGRGKQDTLVPWEGRGKQVIQPWEGRGKQGAWAGRGKQVSRSSGERGNWEGRSTSNRSDFGSGERSGGFRSSSFGSRDSNRDGYTPRSSQYGSRDDEGKFRSSSFGSRDSNKDSYTPRSSQYGSRDDEGKPAYRAPRFSNSRDSKGEYNNTSRSSGSREYVNPGAARFGSTRISCDSKSSSSSSSYSSGGSKYGS